MKDPLYIIGAGGHARVLLNAAIEADMNVAGFLSDLPDDIGTTVLGFPVTDRQAVMSEPGHFIVGVGDTYARMKIYNQMLDANWTPQTVIHPSASISRFSEIGPGSYVGPLAVIQVGVVLGCNVIINSGTIIDHDSSVGDHSHVSAQGMLGGDAHVGERTLVGISASLKNHVTIGDDLIIGVGAAVVTNLDGPGVAYGVPAKLKPLNPNRK